MTYDYLIVGAGFFGATFAWHARQVGRTVLVIDKRPYVGGNCHTYVQDGINVHAHGPHIFHTSDEVVWRFINRFAQFNGYVHRVQARNGDRTFSMPINLTTLQQTFGTDDAMMAQAYLHLDRVPNQHPTDMEQWAKAHIGKRLYELLVRDYTIKQWGRHPRDLPAAILRRLPVRMTHDDSYYDDTHQGIPIGGYTQIFERLLKGCDVRLGVDYLASHTELDALASTTVYSGPIDAFYGYVDGELGYRTLQLETRVLETPQFQPCAQVNHTGLDVPYTRTVEHKHFDPVEVPRTVVTWEVPGEWQRGAEPYYPINDAANNATYARYRERAEREPRTVFGGRLGTYRYYDMHQVIAQAMALAKKEGLTDDRRSYPV